MPNTLCHIGIQAPLNGIVLKKTELLWVIIACVLPDLPWIQLKILLATQAFNPYDLRLYFTAQASLLLCLILSAGLSLMSQHSKKVFVILGANCLFHLLLDSLQIKWGNGVNIISPFNWELFHLDLFWPEYTGTVLFTMIGATYLFRFWRKLVSHNPLSLTPHKLKYSFAAVLLSVYCIIPIFFTGQLEKADTYFIHTMRNSNERSGKTIKLDRAHFSFDDGEVKAWNGEQFKLTGNLPKTSGRVSFSGVFLDSSTIKSQEYHLHKDHRDLASFLGLFMACTLVLQSLVLAKRKSTTSH